VGQLARAFAVFKVERVHVYKTDRTSNQQRDLGLIIRLLRFLDTPQYLRQRVFPHHPSLKYAGLLPPLRMKSHPLAAKVSDLIEGEIRWGLQVKSGSIDLGLDRLVIFRGSTSENVPTLFQVTQTSPRLRIEVVEREDIPSYFGYETESTDDLLTFLADSDDMTRIAFSRMGVAFNSLIDDLRATVAGSGSILAVFGSPRKGIRELVGDRRDDIKKSIDFWINTVRDQGTETVRLEEAVLTSLALVNDSFGQLYAKYGYYQ
jgi:predicted SPOUT superfamily RNA methylase MTH1